MNRTVIEGETSPMKKRIIPNAEQQTPHVPGEGWLDLEQLADLEVTSEDAANPIESALVPGRGSGWRAAESGEQTIRLVFNSPQQIQRIALDFIESQTECTQQFVLRWSSDGGHSYREIVRQQWNFSPRGATRESEDYRVDLPHVTTLELKITPDISGRESQATLARLRLA
ncbi:hypothetical protein [Stieleria mannarensis]|uniref:hypothetical protein n=1 Tax=Stieleria mannarensis TaxID=2755585 RepID=UPI001C71EB44|nr:hypothetical protein [Rhodopirellula sp. JC639]